MESLMISGYQGEPVPNSFVRQGEETRHIAIVFPGFTYPATQPPLHYSTHVLLTMGADALILDYRYARPELAGISSEERRRRLAADVSAVCDAALSQREYERITLIGKSLGTMAMAHLLATDPRLAAAECVWLTPLIRNDKLRAAVTRKKNPSLFIIGTPGWWNTPRWRHLRKKNPSLFVIGTADEQYDPDLMAELTGATGGELLLLEGVNHGLNIEGNVRGSVRAVERIVEALERFLGVTGAST